MEHLSDYNQAAEHYRNLYKSAYGFNPRGEPYDTLEEFERVIKDLEPIVERILTEEAQMEFDLTVDFMEAMRASSSEYNIDLWTAMRWDFQAYSPDTPVIAGENDGWLIQRLGGYVWNLGVSYQLGQALVEWFMAELKTRSL